MLNVLIPCCKGDENQAIQLLEWIAELGTNDANLFILCSDECQHERLVEIGNRGFTSARWVRDAENLKSDWRNEGHQFKSAAGPNSLFRQAAWFFLLEKLGPWLWLEPDAIPCFREWLKVISDEYDSCGKQFMGFLITRETHPGDVGKHMSGVGVYPENTPTILGRALHGTATAFDIAGSANMLPRMHPSNAIFHRYRPPGFTTQEDFDERVKPHHAIWHACKDGSIYPFLRARLGLSQSVARVSGSGLTVTQEEPEVEVATSKELRGPGGSNPPTCDIFIKTRPHDYPWLEWCLKSIDKYASGFNSIQVLTDSHWDFGINKNDNLYTIDTPPKEPGYLWQQVCKLHADNHMGYKEDYDPNDLILFQDSDTIFTRPFSPSDFLRDGKPIWLYDPLDKARPDQHAWVAPMEKFLGKKPEYEFMRRHPFIAPRWALEEMRKFCQYKHGKSLEDYIMGEAIPGHPLALRFSEWNCLGFFLWEFHHDKVCWLRPEEAGPAFCWQGFTHGDEKRMHDDLARFREILDGQPEVKSTAPTLEISPEVTPTETLDIPWAIRFIADHVKDTPHKARIIREIKKAWKGKGEPSKTRPKAIPAKANGHPEKLDVERVTEEFKERVATRAIHKDRILLCIHSYPGANDTFRRHWPSYQQFGADRIVGVGTTDGKCTWPDGLDAVVDIGENAYLGPGDALCRRMLDTVKWCLTQPEDKFAIIEYDTIPLRRMPEWFGVSACLTGGKVNGSLANQFFHNPWLFDRASGPALVAALEQVLPESASYPNNSPDLFFGLACERAGIKVGCNFKLFTRNRLESPEDVELACKAVTQGYHVIHGVKTAAVYQTIMNTSDVLVSK